MNRQSRFCDGLARRDFLRIGSAGVFGASWSLANMAAASKSDGSSDRSLIIIFLQGGLSTIDTFDMKLDAPAEIRGEFKPISTNVPGTVVCEHLPQTAKQMDKFSLIRSFTHPNSSHSHADHYMLTGYHPTPAFQPSAKPNNERPSHGSIIAKKLGAQGSIPPYVCLPDFHKSCGAAYLGPAASPFVINSNPNDPAFRVRDIVPPLDLDPTRIDARRQLLSTVDRYQASVEAEINARPNRVTAFKQKAFELMTSAATKRAFNINEESEKLRDEYGRNTLGQSCLMARRLVESGVRCVAVNHVDWDTHESNFTSLKRDLLPHFDPAMATLFHDLSDRGMLEQTMVLVTGEFGRTPRINAGAGRDHWGPSFTVMLGGGGIHGGHVVGSTTKDGSKPADSPYGPEDLAATIHHQLGINPDDEFYTPEGRPVKIVNDGRLIKELI